MAVKLWLPEIPQFFDSNGDPLSGGLLFFYLAGSSTKTNTYTDSTGATPNANPMVLNAAGRPAQAIWLTAGVSYKIGLAVATESDPPSGFISPWPIDNVTGVNDSTTTLDEWQSGPAPTFVSATSFTLAGDQTTVFTVGRRVKITDAGGTKYGTIKTSTFTTLTTVVLDSQDSDALTSPTSAVSYGILNPANTSEPVKSDAIAIIGGSADRSKRVRFEVDGITTGTTRVWTAPDGNITFQAGTAAITAEFAYANLFGASGRLLLPPGYIQGMIPSNNAGDATNDIDVSAGVCADATFAQNIILTAITKRSDANWAVGTNQGGLDTGAVGNSDYYIWAIKRSDTGVSDVLFSLSSTAPTMPTSYDFKRLIGWFKRSGGTIVAFKGYELTGGGLEFLWNAPAADIALANTLTTSRRTDALSVPLNFSVEALLNVVLSDAAGALVYICCPDVSDQAPSTGGSPGYNAIHVSGQASHGNPVQVRTSATGTIASRSDTATVDDYRVFTVGFKWSRR